MNSESKKLNRDCFGVLIPVGTEIHLKKGAEVIVTQALGGSFTVYVAGNLYRVAGQDADAIGHEPVEPPSLPPEATDDDIEKVIWDQMKTVYDPEIPVNIVDLGLIYDCEIEIKPQGVRNVAVKMTLTAPGCGMGDILVDDVAAKIELVPTVDNVNVELVFDPPWGFEMMSYEAKLETGML